MALAWSLTDSQAKNIYNALYKWYNSPNNFPNFTTGAGVFFKFANYTLDKLYYTIEFLKKTYHTGWFSDDYSQRSSAIKTIANELYNVFAGQVSVDAIIKFCNFVYSFAKNNPDAVNYFAGGAFDILDTAGNILNEVVVKPIESAVETISYGVSYPSLESLFPETKTLVKWVLLIGGGLILWNYIKK